MLFSFAGGFVGDTDTNSVVNDAYALGRVTAQGAGIQALIGGFVGLNNAGAISTVLFDGRGVGPSRRSAGPVGDIAGGSIVNAYYTGTSGQVQGAGFQFAGTLTNVTGLTTAQFHTASNLAGFTFGTAPGGAGWVIVDADGSLNNAGGAAGATRPLLLSEYSGTIANVHQLQLMELNLSASYTLSANIDASENGRSGNPSGLWTTSGFVPRRLAEQPLHRKP